MLRKIYLHGGLAEKYGEVFRLDVETAGEAVRALSTIVPGFMQDVREGAYHVVVGDDTDETGFSLDVEGITGLRLGAADLHIIPYVAGSKRGGVLKVVLGVALLGAAFMFSGGILSTAIGGGVGLLGGLTYGNMAMLGVALAAAGVSALLSPEEKSTEKQDSFTMNGPGNAYEQGLPVPLVFGEVITGGVMVSGGIDIEQIPVGA